MKKKVNGGKVGLRRAATMKRVQKEQNKSALAKRAERLFSFQNSEVVVIPESYPTQPTAPTIVQTFTTYSVCEDPIPDLPKQRQQT